jgi:lipid II:glycine glycyltransferase (peptidoglycan interpeptide bridge formation enzyme)
MTISIILLLLNNLILKEIKSKRVMEMLLNGKKEKMLQLKSSRKRIKIKKLDKKLLKVNKLKNNHSSIFSTLLKLILMMKMKMNKIKILILNFYNNNTNLPLIFMIK